MAVGNRIAARQRAVTSDVIEKFRALPVANVSDSMGRMAAGGASLRPFHRGGILAGPAVTVKARPGDNLMVHAALDRAQPGDVVVVDAGGDLTNAIIGELMVAHAAHRGLAGIVITAPSATSSRSAKATSRSMRWASRIADRTRTVPAR